MMPKETMPGFSSVAQTGVIYVVERAREKGYSPADKSWANLGQGSPETGKIAGAPERVNNLFFSQQANNYGSVLGLRELREKVADFYNSVYRKDKRSKYTYENVAICGGGRVALARIATILERGASVGHFVPDYTAYEELFSVFGSFEPVRLKSSVRGDFHLVGEELADEISEKNLQAILLSNPCNPTGQVLQGDELKKWVMVAGQKKCSIVFDEFYSHYIYDEKKERPKLVSSARFVEDVNRDPILIVDGLTKNWRYPGWRLSWILGPKKTIEQLDNAGSFLDGGANHPFQHRAIELLEVSRVKKEAQAIQKLFRKKRDWLIMQLKKIDIRPVCQPRGAFYVWADLSRLPEPIKRADDFFEEGLKEKFITVPGAFFDINSQKARKERRYQSRCRISFGPDWRELKTGIESMARLVKKFSSFR